LGGDQRWHVSSGSPRESGAWLFRAQWKNNSLDGIRIGWRVKLTS
jgi:hypothetical protein